MAADRISHWKVHFGKDRILATPVVTKSVGALHNKHAAGLAEIVMLDGNDFARAYMDFMVKSHSNVQNLIDKCLAMTNNKEVKNHLTETRKTITMHLQQAKELQGKGHTRVVSLTNPWRAGEVPCVTLNQCRMAQSVACPSKFIGFAYRLQASSHKL